MLGGAWNIGMIELGLGYGLMCDGEMLENETDDWKNFQGALMNWNQE